MKKVEISRRKFLQGSVALCVYTTSSSATIIPKKTTKTTTTKATNIPYLCNMCRNKCAGFARVEDGILTKLNPNQYFQIRRYKNSTFRRV